MIIALIVLAVWLTGWTVTARRLFARWRPSRVPLCGVKQHHSYSTPVGHGEACFHRRKADLTHVHVDHDSEAAGWALLAGVAWPMVIIVFALMHSPPELPAEKRKRVADMEKEAGIE